MHRIKKMKEKLIEEAQNRMQAMDGGSIEQMGQIVDMIKDLSEAEKACLEAEYYDTVIDAMDGDGRYGYDKRGVCLQDDRCGAGILDRYDGTTVAVLSAGARMDVINVGIGGDSRRHRSFL